MKVDSHMIPILLFMNIHVHADTWVILSDLRPHFFNDPRMCFFYDYLGRRRWRGCFRGGGCYRRRCLLTSGNPE